MAAQRRSERSLELRLQARPELVHLPRARLRAWLEDAGASTSEVFEVLLATTEAFTNTVEHSHEPRNHLIDVEGSITDNTMTVSIRNYGTWQSEQARKEQGGLGLVLMEALMDSVQIGCVADGTTVTMQRRLTAKN